MLVQEKLDGSNVAIANIDGVVVPLVRSGYVANTYLSSVTGQLEV